MSDRQSPWWSKVGTGESLILKVKRGAQMPLPWTWEIASADGEVAAQRSLKGYRSAEEAYAAGRAALDDLEHGGAPAR